MSDENKVDSHARACLCGETDHRLVVFTTQIAFGLLSSGFFMYQISRGADSGVYLPLLTSILGYFMPSPSFKK
jgi:hypothetical protein